MTTAAASTTDFVALARTLGLGFAERAAAHDAEGRFVADNYAELKAARLFSAAVPAELGGGGASYAESCAMLRELAQHCGSTALALSMHTHLVAAAVFRYRRGQPGEALLRKIAASELVLVSTGAGDWVESVGRAERVPGGYRVSGVKGFGSGCPAGDLLMTSAPFDDPEQGAQVLGFPVSLRAEGVSLRSDWDALGMRGTGSHSIELKDVFVPEESVSVRRPRGKWHPSWNVTMCVAPPIYTAPYVGVAERAAELGRGAARGRETDAVTLQLLGEVENQLTVAQMALREMVELVDDYRGEPSDQLSSRLLTRKTIAANAAIATVTKAVELTGGSAYFRRGKLERLLRDVLAAPFHPLPEKRQQLFSARVALGLSPIG